MANTVNTHTRFYPVNGVLDRNHFLKLYAIFQKQLWRSWYYFNERERCIEVIYPSKSHLDFDLFTHQSIVDHFHIWGRCGDYSCYEDILTFKSLHCPIIVGKIDPKCKYNFDIKDEWNLATSCLYTADELLIRFKYKDQNYINSLLSIPYNYPDALKFQDELTCSLNLMMIYMKSSYTDYINDFTGEHLEMDYFSSELGWGKAEVWQWMCNNPGVKLKALFLDRLYKNRPSIQESNPHEYISEVLFKWNNKTMYKFEWKDGHFNQRSDCSWDNCINPEFTAFKTWYKQMHAG